MQFKSPLIALLAIAAMGTAVAHDRSPPPLVRFSGTIGVDPLTAAGGVDTLNVVRGINPGGRAWMLRTLKASVAKDGTLTARGTNLVFTSGDGIGGRGAVTHVAATLACGPAATARKFNTGPFELDLYGNFRINGKLSEDGINAAVMPDTCDTPVLLIRSANPTTGVLGNWFAAGIPAPVSGDDD